MADKKKTTDKELAYHRAYMKAHPDADKTMPARRKRYNKKHPGRVKARNDVNNAISLGKMKDLPAGQDYHHGAGYSKKNAKRVTPMSHRDNAKKK